jgi:hypothetical protein
MLDAITNVTLTELAAQINAAFGDAESNRLRAGQLLLERIGTAHGSKRGMIYSFTWAMR